VTLEYASVQRELAQAGMKGRTLTGYASVFDYPIEAGTQSHPQTHFVKQGAFNRTLEKHPTPQVLLNHGQDPQVGQKPLGVPEVVKVDPRGLYVEVPLDKTSYNDDIIVSLASGALRGMSIMFETEQESYNEDRTERYIEQVRLYEFGPVTFPANEAATASLHSLRDFAPERHWDGAAALRSCETASEFRQIAFERNNDSDPDTAAHWALPHHPRPGAGPDSAGVAAALGALSGGRGGAPDLKPSVESVRSHLEAHQAEASSDRGHSALYEASLSWVMKDGEAYERYLAELAETDARIRRIDVRS
jgi:HK97 family phage prohead protease